MVNPELSNSNDVQSWDMSDVPFAGGEEQKEKEVLSRELKYAPELLANSAIFGGYGKTSEFTNTILSGDSNESILANIKKLDNGRYKINYGTDDLGKGFTGLGQVSGALDYFDEKYGDLTSDDRAKGFLKTCIAMWPMGNVGSFGVHEFAKSAKIDKETASLVNMIIDRNSMKLVEAHFDKGSEGDGMRLQEINKQYLVRLNGGLGSGYEDKAAQCACNMQKIIMDCAKNGARIAKERKNK